MNWGIPYVKPPQNQTLLEKISNTVEVVVKNGEEFEQLLKRKVSVYPFHVIAN